MDINAIKNQLKGRDRVIRILSKDGLFRGVALKNTIMAKDAQLKHNLDALPAFFLAKAMSAATLISAFLKGEERISIDIEGNGIIERLFAEAIQVGETRGFVRVNSDYDESRLSTLDEALGFGKMRISRVLYNKTEPVVGITELVQGDISTDLAYYFRQSEQIPSAVLLDASIDDSGKIKQSGGLIIQAMPQAPLKDIARVTEKLYNMKPISEMLEQGLTTEDIMREAVDFDFEVVKHAPVDFFCRCSKETFLNRLITLGNDEIKDMRENAHNEVVCQYCNEKYIIEDADFDRILTEIQAQKN